MAKIYRRRVRKEAETDPIQPKPVDAKPGTVRKWVIRSQNDGGKLLLIDGTMHGYGAVLPKLKNDLFKSLRDDNVIELASNDIAGGTGQG